MQIILDIFYGYIIFISVASILAIVWIIINIDYEKKIDEYSEPGILDRISLGILMVNPIILLVLLIVYIKDKLK